MKAEMLLEQVSAEKLRCTERDVFPNLSEKLKTVLFKRHKLLREGEMGVYRKNFIGKDSDFVL